MFTRNISKYALLAASIGGMVGSGWLFGPFYAAKVAGPASIISWIVAGLLMLVIAYTFVLLTRVHPIAGGTVRFFQMTHGHFVGFSLSWVAWLAWVSVTPIETMALIQYASNYWTGLMQVVDGSKVLTNMGILVAVVLMVIMYIINVMSMKLITKTNVGIVFFKLAIPLITVILLFSLKFDSHNFTVHHGFMPMGWHGVLAALPAAGVIFSFIGFNPAIQLAQEVKDPSRSIPFAILGSLVVCIILYVLIQVAFIGALSTEPFKAGWQHLTFAGDNGPFAGLILALGLVWFVKLLYIDAVISPFGTAMVQATATSRLTYAMSQNGYFPRWMQDLNSKSAPAKAMTVNLIVGFFFLLPFPSWQKMVGFLVSCLVFGYIVGPMALMTIKLKDNTQLPGFSKSALHVLCLAAFFICNLLIFWTGWDVMQKVLVAFVIGYIILMVCYVLSNRSMVLNIKSGFWMIPYLIGLFVLSYLGSFGGGLNVLPFGWDFLVMAIFTVLIYALCYNLASKNLD